MSSPQDTRFITSRTIDTMSEHYKDIWDDFKRSADRAWDTDLIEAFGEMFREILSQTYYKAQMGCQDALRDGAIASQGISEGLATCAHNWRTAEQASIVDYR
ncbi:hypothetical protein [Nonomuraea sp. 10N515B]|uniref:hypothetical protein n=1 Tax=Nonomuraea sp. 10N515B TaxID=3457422 RepID=UPI003FCDE354